MSSKLKVVFIIRADCLIEFDGWELVSVVGLRRGTKFALLRQLIEVEELEKVGQEV